MTDSIFFILMFTMFITFKDAFRKHRGMWHFTCEEKKPGEAKLLARIETQVPLFLKLD